MKTEESKVGFFTMAPADFVAGGFRFRKTRSKKRGFHIAPLQSAWVVEKLKISQEELATDLRLLLSSGEQLRGAEVYRYLMKRIWWATPLYLLSILPILRDLFDAGYRAFADNRYWISRACHLPATDETKRERPHSISEFLPPR